MIRSTCLLWTAAALLAVSAPALRAQSFHFANGTDSLAIVSLPANHFVGGLDVDSAGNLYFIDVDGSFTGTNTGTHLYERSAANGAITDLYDLSPNQAVYASFVRLHGSDLYWGETSTNTVFRADLGTRVNGQLSPQTFGQFNFNYDLAFASNGAVALVANPSTDFSNPNTHVYKLNLAAPGLLTPTNGAASKVDAGAQYSGPIAFAPSGNLYYGSASGNIYRYSAAEVATSTNFTLDAAHQVAANAANAYMAFNATGTLYQDAGNSLTAYPFSQGTAAFAIGNTDSAFSLGNVATANGLIYVSATEYGGDSYIYAVPEPGSATLLVLAAGGCLGLRRRRA